MDAVCVIDPEVNHDHLGFSKRSEIIPQAATSYLSNCSTIMVALALAPLHARFWPRISNRDHLQAVSGAGYRVSHRWTFWISVPFIRRRRRKMEAETKKILAPCW